MGDMDNYISQTEELGDVSIERIFSTDQMSLELWMVKISQELRESERPSLYGVGIGGSIIDNPIIHRGIIYFGCFDKNFSII